MDDAFAEIKDTGGDLAGWEGEEDNEFVFEQAVFELRAGYPAGDVYLRVEAKHVQKKQEEEMEPEQADMRESETL